MKKMLLAICSVLVMSSIAFSQVPQPCPIQNWTQFGCPDWTCPTNPDPNGAPDSCKPVTLEEMGSFIGDGWNYDPLYLNQMSTWGSNNANQFQQAWMPLRGLIFSGNPTLQSSFRSDGSKATRVNFSLPEDAATYPEVYRWLKDGAHQAFVANFTTEEIPGSTGICSSQSNPGGKCTYPAFTKKYSYGPIAFEAIQGISWKEKTLASELPVLSSQHPLQVQMDLSSPPSASPNYSPIYGKYNFWNGPTAFPPLGNSRVMALWPGVIPEKDAESTIQVNINGVVHDLFFAGGDTDNIPPIVQTTDVNSKGKTVQKLAPFEENGNLVIKVGTQNVTTPYMNLNVYVGSPWPAGSIPEEAWFASIESVPQASILVLPKASWDAVKSKLSASGYSRVQVHVTYQRIYMKPAGIYTPNGTSFQVRGQSEAVQIPYQ